MKAFLVRLTGALVPFVEMKTNICKHCGLTLQGMENEGEDICVDCLADLCFKPSAIIKIGCIKQTEADNEQEETDE
jgi:hypothetical protein